MSSSPKMLSTIQALRAFAAAAVVSYHVFYMLVHNAGYSFAIPVIGSSGVDLFFVISGFIMIYTTSESFCQPNASIAFIRRRIIRIAPMYWLYTTGVVFLLAFLPGLFAATKFNWTNVISSYFFLLSENTAGQIGTVMQTGWTLCFEIYFYFWFAILLNLPRRYFLITIAAIFTSGIILGNASNHIYPWATVATDPILFEFLLGAIVAFLFIKKYSLPRFIAIAVIFLGITTLILANNYNLGIWSRVICRGLPYCAILLGAISLEKTGMQIPRIFVALGNSSYSLYLVHPFILPAFGKMWLVLHLGEKASPIILAVLAFSCSVLMGHALYLLIEKPCTRWLSKNWKENLSVSFRNLRNAQIEHI